VVPCDVPSTRGVTEISAPRASDVDSSDAGDSTMARSPTLATGDATRGGHRDVAGRVVD
jgi:hypothetical protein